MDQYLGPRMSSTLNIKYIGKTFKIANNYIEDPLKGNIFTILIEALIQIRVLAF